MSITVEISLHSNGPSLCPERYSAEKLRSVENALGGYYFGALYQQNPTAREGAFFRVSQLQVVDAAPAGLRCVRAWDMAATAGGGNYTAGVKVGTAGDGRFYVLDVVRGRWATDERDSVIRQTAALDGRATRIHGPQDPGAAGKDAALSFARMLAGYPVRTESVSGSKEIRADPFSSQVNAGNVRLLRGDWNRDFIEELRLFANGAKHDDQVDAAADAFTELVSTGNVGRPAVGGQVPHARFVAR